MSLTIGKTNVTDLLKKTYKKLGKGYISLMEVPTEKYLDVNAEALKILINEMKFNGIYITLSKSYDELNKLYKSKGVDTNNLFFIDAVSQMYGLKETVNKKCIYVSGPLDIDSISSALRELLSEIKGKKCVFLDSITTVLLYNSLPRTLRFSQFLTKTLKKLGIDGVMVSIAKGTTTEKLVKELAKLCDEAISIGNEGATQKT